MNEIKTENGVWGFVFLSADGILSLDDKMDIVRQGVEMFYKNEDERRLKTDNYEGRVFTKRQFEMIGMLGGQKFDAELETDKGKVKLRFLVSDQTEQRGYDLSSRLN